VSATETEEKEREKDKKLRAEGKITFWLISTQILIILSVEPETIA